MKTEGAACARCGRYHIDMGVEIDGFHVFRPAHEGATCACGAKIYTGTTTDGRKVMACFNGHEQSPPGGAAGRVLASHGITGCVDRRVYDHDMLALRGEVERLTRALLGARFIGLATESMIARADRAETRATALEGALRQAFALLSKRYLSHVPISLYREIADLLQNQPRGTTAPTPEDPMDVEGIKNAVATKLAEWWEPTPEDQTKFCTDHNVPAEYAEGYPGGDVPNEPGTWQGVIAKLPDDASDELLKQYHGMGYTRDGHRASWTKAMLDEARKKCTDLKDASTPEDQDAIAGDGARNLPTETVRILLLGQGAGNTAYFGPLKNNPTISNAANFCVGIEVSSASGQQ
jgi:hypothetical protein